MSFTGGFTFNQGHSQLCGNVSFDQLSLAVITFAAKCKITHLDVVVCQQQQQNLLKNVLCCPCGGFCVCSTTAEMPWYSFDLTRVTNTTIACPPALTYQLVVSIAVISAVSLHMPASAPPLRSRFPMLGKLSYFSQCLAP